MNVLLPPMPKKDQSKMFWALVYKTSTCWLFFGNQAINGYGRFCGMYAHRFSYLLKYGTIDPSMFVLHKCDIPSCVRPSHLYLGDDYDNWQDARARNHGNRGEMNGMSARSRSERASG